MPKRPATPSTDATARALPDDELAAHVAAVEAETARRREFWHGLVRDLNVVDDVAKAIESYRSIHNGVASGEASKGDLFDKGAEVIDVVDKLVGALRGA